MADPIKNVPGRSEIVDIYAKTLARLNGVIAGEDFTKVAKARAAAKIIEINKHINHLRKQQSAWAKVFIPEAYKNGALQDIPIIKKVRGNAANVSYGTLHRSAATVAVEGAIQDFSVVADSLDRTYVGYVRRAQYQGNKQRIAEEIAGGIVEGASRQTTSVRILEELKRKANKGLIVVGKVTMNANDYADMLARTLSRAARTEGVLNTLNANDVDLVIYNDTGAVDFCVQYENQIFSISGNSGKYPMLVERPPLHPNCTHSISAFFEEFSSPAEIKRGTEYDKRDVGKTSAEMNKKYPITKDDTRTRTKKTQKAKAA